MKRRQLLSLLALSTSFAGCIENNPSDGATETETPYPEGVTANCWPSRCEGSKLVEVVVAHDFSGDVVLQAECRGEAFSIQAGESVQIDREENAETCRINLSINGEQKFSNNIEDYESVTLTVGPNGEVEDRWVVT